MKLSEIRQKIQDAVIDTNGVLYSSSRCSTRVFLVALRNFWEKKVKWVLQAATRMALYCQKGERVIPWSIRDLLKISFLLDTSTEQAACKRFWNRVQVRNLAGRDDVISQSN